MNYTIWENIAGHSLEYLDDTHTYLVDGVLVPSITQILKIKFGQKYNYVRKDTLEITREKGTEVHKAIEEYCKNGVDVELKELKNFKFLQKHYNFEVLDNEVPIILFFNDKPVAAGRLDLVLKTENDIGLGDIKRTTTLDKEYLAYQLNFYRIAYQQCYGEEIKFLSGLHLKDNIRKYVNIPINEELALELLEKYLEGENND